MPSINSYYVTYRSMLFADAPTSTCIAQAEDEDAVRMWFDLELRHIIAITPKDEAPSWMGEGKSYSTIYCDEPHMVAERAKREIVSNRGGQVVNLIKHLVAQDVPCDEAIDTVCGTDTTKYGCLVAALIERIGNTSVLLEAITRSCAAYLESSDERQEGKE